MVGECQRPVPVTARVVRSERCGGVAACGAWFGTLRRSMIFIAAAGPVWEFARMPLDTLWDTGTAAEIVFAAEHYAGGDVLIAIGAVISELFLDGNPAWPDTRRPHVIARTMAFGFPRTAIGEWRNIEVRQAWSCGKLVPVIPAFDAGRSPVLQRITVPPVAFRAALPVAPEQVSAAAHA